MHPVRVFVCAPHRHRNLEVQKMRAHIRRWHISSEHVDRDDRFAVCEACYRAESARCGDGGLMGYRCVNCKQPVEIDYERRGVRCPYCGHRILVKERPVRIKRVLAE